MCEKHGELSYTCQKLQLGAMKHHLNKEVISQGKKCSCCYKIPAAREST